METKKSILLQIPLNLLYYVFPGCIITFQIIHKNINVHYFILDLISLALLAFVHIRSLIDDRKIELYSGKSIKFRRFYYVYFIFLMILLSPEIKSLNFFSSGQRLWGLSDMASTYAVFFIISIIVYVLIVSDLNISEVSFLNTKISMNREKYKDFLNENKVLTDYHEKRIYTEHILLEGMKKYCKIVINRLRTNNGDFFITNEYQILLNKYYQQLKEDIIVEVTDDLILIKNKHSLSDKDYTELMKNLQVKEENDKVQVNTYCIYQNGIYIYCIPYVPRFNGYDKTVYIVLESSHSMAFKLESYIISNLLMVFSDEFLNQTVVEFTRE